MPLKPANQVVSQAVSWLWPDRIPLGKLLILDGDPDLGKSLLTPRTPLEEEPEMDFD